MEDIQFILTILCSAVFLFTIIYFFFFFPRPFRRAVYTVLSGLLSLIAVNVTGIFTGVSLPVSTLSICISAVGGIPAVTAMVIIDTFFK